MGNPVREVILPVVRPLLIALGLAAIGALLLLLRPEEDAPGSFASLYLTFGAVLFFVAAAGFIFVPLLKAVVGFFESLFNPGGTYTPPALHRLPEWYCTQGRYQEAVDEYEKILTNYPQDATAWIGLINAHVYYMGNRAAGERILQRARHKLKKPEDRQAAEEHFRMLTLTAAPPAAEDDSSSQEP